MKLKENEILILEHDANIEQLTSIEELRNLIEKAGADAENWKAYIAKPIKLVLIPSRVQISRESKERKAKTDPKTPRKTKATVTKQG